LDKVYFFTFVLCLGYFYRICLTNSPPPKKPSIVCVEELEAEDEESNIFPHAPLFLVVVSAVEDFAAELWHTFGHTDRKLDKG
jgi:hypothetical protein